MSYVLAFLGFAALVLLHELGHFAAAKAVGMRVERFSLFFPPRITGIQRGDTDYQIGAIPLGGYVKISGMSPHEEIPPEHAHRAYFRQPPWKRIVVILAGPMVNLVLAFAILWVLFMAAGPPKPAVGDIEHGKPAAGVLMSGDILVAVDGRRGDPQQLADRISSHHCTGSPTKGCRARTTTRITVDRDGATRTFTLRPVYDPKTSKTRVGFSFINSDQREAGVGPLPAAGDSGTAMWRVASATVSTIAQLFKPAKRKQLNSVVGGYEVTRAAFSVDTYTAFQILALISLSLGLINLFPFLPLDGGHIFWAVAEKVRGRAIPFAVMERAGVVGFVLVLGLFAIGLSNDIPRLFDGGFQLR